MLHHLQALQVRQPPPRLLPLLRLPCLRCRRLRRLRRLRLLRNELDAPPLLEHMSVLNLLVNLVLARLAPPRLLPPLAPPLVPLVPKERACNPKQLVLPLDRLLNRLLDRLALHLHGGQCLARNLPVLA